MGDERDGEPGGMARRLWITATSVGGAVAGLFGAWMAWVALATGSDTGLWVGLGVAVGGILAARLVYRWGLWIVRGR